MGGGGVRVRFRGRVRDQPPPVQPVKVEPAAGVAVKVTVAPLANAEEQVGPHAMPPRLLGPGPGPPPGWLTVSMKDCCSAKVAVREVAAFSVTIQVPAPEQPPPLQPVKVEPAAGVAVRRPGGPR